MANLLLILILVPAPTRQSLELFPGSVDLTWSGGQQISHFDADGTYRCSLGDGHWVAHQDGPYTIITFLEGCNWYEMRLDEHGVGGGWRIRWASDGSPHCWDAVAVKAVRRKPMPKGDP